MIDDLLFGRALATGSPEGPGHTPTASVSNGQMVNRKSQLVNFPASRFPAGARPAFGGGFGPQWSLTNNRQPATVFPSPIRIPQSEIRAYLTPLIP